MLGLSLRSSTSPNVDYAGLIDGRSCLRLCANLSIFSQVGRIGSKAALIEWLLMADFVEKSAMVSMVEN